MGALSPRASEYGPRGRPLGAMSHAGKLDVTLKWMSFSVDKLPTLFTRSKVEEGTSQPEESGACCCGPEVNTQDGTVISLSAKRQGPYKKASTINTAPDLVTLFVSDSGSGTCNTTPIMIRS